MKYVLMGMVLLALAWPCHAHKSSDSYLRVNVESERITGEWDIALRDLEFALGLDRDGNGELTWSEVRGARERIEAYAYSRLKLRDDNRDCALNADDLLVDSHSDGAYAVLRFHARCVLPMTALTVDYRLLFDLDAQHRGLLRLTAHAQASSAVFAPDAAVRRFDLGAAGAATSFHEFVALGAEHIVAGVDHLLFLFALLLPSVVRRVDGRWQGVDCAGPALIGVAKVVTAFTVAHSITLSLAVFGIAQPPSRWVESAIAASIVVAALNNLWPVVKDRNWMVAFGFGLMHGFGFAGALTDLGLTDRQLGAALFGFNFGVELAQLALVALVVPAMFALRHRVPYRRLVLAPSSAVIAAIGILWMLERVLDISIAPLFRGA